MPIAIEPARSYSEDLMVLRSIAHEGLAREDDVQRLLVGPIGPPSERLQRIVDELDRLAGEH